MALHARMTYWHHYFSTLLNNAYQYLVVVLLVMAVSTFVTTYQNYVYINRNLACTRSSVNASIEQKRLTDGYYKDILALQAPNGTPEQRTERARKYQHDLEALNPPICT